MTESEVTPSRWMKWPEERKERLRELWAAGLSGSQCAAELGDGITKNAVIGMVHRLGLPTPAKKRPPSPPKVSNPKPKKEVIMQPVSEQPSAPALAPIIPDLTPIVAIPVSKRVRLVNLKENHCRWPIGDGADLVFCGGERLSTKRGSMREPYCEFHRRLSIAKAGKPQSEEANLKSRLAMLKVGQDAFAPARAKKAAKAS